MTTADTYRQHMANAIDQYQTAKAMWHAVTRAYLKPGRDPADSERLAATDFRRVRAEARQAFWSNEAGMYALAAIAETITYPGEPE